VCLRNDLGKARVIVDGETKELTQGMSVIIPPRKTHQIFNETSELLVFLAVCVPAWTPECSVFE